MFTQPVGFYNWTVTYRSDSTFQLSYGQIARKDGVFEEAQQWLPYNEEQFKLRLKSKPKAFLALAERPKLVAWLVSHCNASSGRDEYVELLQKEIPGKQYERAEDNFHLHSPVHPYWPPWLLCIAQISGVRLISLIQLARWLGTKVTFAHLS